MPERTTKELLAIRATTLVNGIDRVQGAVFCPRPSRPLMREAIQRLQFSIREMAQFIDGLPELPHV